jgi:RNA-directed DNA polymerase
MTGSDSMLFGLENIWVSWLNFKKGKTKTREYYLFEYDLENNLIGLYQQISTLSYKHGSYRNFYVCDNKKRTISEPQIRDKIVHRLIYNYLLPIFDNTFDFDVWSCRKDKGLTGALIRTKFLLKNNPGAFVWRSDIKKYFENINHEILFNLIKRKVREERAIYLIREILESFYSDEDKKIGIPLGNLTSQIFSNIFLNELDRYVRHTINPLAYIRYGDDFIVIMRTQDELALARRKIVEFLDTNLKLVLNPKNDIIVKTNHGLRFLGAFITPEAINLNKRNRKRVIKKLNTSNASSYFGLVKKYGSGKLRKQLKWKIFEVLTQT